MSRQEFKIDIIAMHNITKKNITKNYKENITKKNNKKMPENWSEKHKL